MLWVDPKDPSVIAAVWHGTRLPVPDLEIFPTPAEGEDIAEAIAIAGEVLMRLSGFKLHPAGCAEEDYMATPRVHRLTPTFRPIREVTGVYWVCGTDGDPTVALPWTPCLVGQDVYFNERHCDLAWMMGACGCEKRETFMVKMAYRFGSTITRAARRALLIFAHELYLGIIGDDECQLPDRVTSVNREGISYTVIDPQTFLDKGFTGLARVDSFLAPFNPDKARRPSAVYTPDSPPGVAVCVRTATFAEPPPVVNPL